MPEKKSVPTGMSELRKTVATSLGTAFGIVIGMIWTNVVMSGFATAGVNMMVTGSNWMQWSIFVVTAIVVTVMCVILIVLIGRWGGKK